MGNPELRPIMTSFQDGSTQNESVIRTTLAQNTPLIAEVVRLEMTNSQLIKSCQYFQKYRQCLKPVSDDRVSSATEIDVKRRTI